MSKAKDLSKEAPRSPRERIGGYAILGRTLDKGRADINGTIGEYHFDCPLDNMLFEFKGVKGADVRKLLELGAGDEDLVTWFNTNGADKNATEIKDWSDAMEAYNPTDNPEKKEWFAERCAKAGIDPNTNTLFDWLEVDDKLSFGQS